MGIKVKVQLKGFDDLLERIKDAGGKLGTSAEKACDVGGKVIHDAMKGAVETSPISADTKAKILDSLRQPVTIKYGNSYWASCRFKMGAYDPDNPSGGYLAIFNEFGTDQRKTKDGRATGKLSAMHTIIPAVQKAKPAIKKAQKDALNEILKELEG